MFNYKITVLKKMQILKLIIGYNVHTHTHTHTHVHIHTHTYIHTTVQSVGFAEYAHRIFAEE